MAKPRQKQPKTQLAAFIKKLGDPERQKDANAIIAIMQDQSGFEAKMWGPAIIGFGSYHYVYESGREGDAPLVAFSPRKTEFSLYLSSQFEKREELLKKLGKHKSAKGCVYIKKMAEVDADILKKMVANSLKYYKAKYK
jgi:hypothetical protein